ncbi:hypothetical protein [Haemophilus haemolyticus]|uniref:Uncharacterized protein n=1 Tax=Haemophilus haemolyticus TaxID=726 RepID=A0A0M3G920_HAEHA|nr:hypothetical protein [Haemophilus haemolyticus]KKZ59550.1 hypothetical protein AAX18_00985 [Haemophilus haemolyticus]
MSKNISVKINNGNKTIETVKLNAANQKVIIKAQPHVNYELVDDATQYAPEMIDTKRVGNDLYIAFEDTDINKDVDLVLEGYYEHDNTELVLGMAEDGQYYAYVPQSGVESDAVTLLADQIFAPQALGGNSVAAPFWAFNPNWLWVAAGVAAVGGIIAAASGSHGGGSSNNATDKPSDNSDANNNSNTAKDTTAPAKPTVEAKDNGSVDVTPPVDADTKSVEVNYTDEAGTPKTATLTKGNDGNWTSNNPDVAVDPATGKATIPADKVKDGSPVTAKATDTAGNTGEEGTANAGDNPDTTAPAKPTIEAKTNGFVYITPPADAKSVEVHYIDEKGNPQTVTITKDADKGWVSSNLENIWLNSETGKITLLAHKVKGGSLVKASATDNKGNTGEEATSEQATANAVDIPDTYGPSMPETRALEDRSVSVTMPKEAEVGDFVVIKRAIYKEHGDLLDWSDDIDTAETLATLTKQQDGSWISDKPENVPNVKAGNDSTIIPANKLKGFENVYVGAMDPAGNSSGVPQTFLPNEMDAPKVTVETGGFVEITPPAAQDLKSMKVRYTDKAGTQKITILTKGEDGNWTSDNLDVTVEPTTGKAMISADKIQAGSKVTAKAFANSGIISREDYQTVGEAPKTPAPSAPEIIPSTTDGSVTVKVPDDAKVGDKVDVSIVPEKSDIFLNPEDSNIGVGVTLTKNADGSWTSDYPIMLPNIAAGQNSTTIPQDQVKDGSNVTAQARNPDYNYSAKVTAQAGEDTGDAKDPDEAGVSSNTIDSNGMGSSGDDYASFDQIAGTINMGAGNDILEARSTEMPFSYFYTFSNAKVDMGSGDDIIRTSGSIYSRESINGGDDFDTLEFVNRDGKEIRTSISEISNFEKIDIKGTLNNTLNIQKDDVERNHSAKPTVDDSGKSHNNVLIVDGDEGDKVNLSEISKVASSQVDYKGNTYHVYLTGSNELWVDSDIAVG